MQQQTSRSSDNSMTPPTFSSRSSTDGNLPSSLVQQLTAITKLLSTQQTVRVDQLTTLLNEAVSLCFHVASFECILRRSCK